MPQFILTGIGSYGDVHPIVGLGAALATRGHRVKVIANPYFANVVADGGVEFVPVSTAEEYIQLSQHPDLWHPIRGPALALRQAAGGLARPLYELAAAHYVPGETVFCAHPLDLGTRVAAEKLSAPIASIDLSPATLWSIHDSPRLKGALTGPLVPKWLKRAQYWMSDKFFVHPILSGPLNELRGSLQMQLIEKRIFTNWLHATDLIIGLFPAWFAPLQPDWPPSMRLTGFPLWDAHEDAVLADDVQEFLAAGDPPIAFSPGSANRAAEQFYAAAFEACQALGRRGLFLTKYAEQLPANLPASVRHFGFLPLSHVLPHTAALVHHGGIGTCAQALAAGVPQVVRPMSFDQFDNSRRLVRLGVAEELSVRRFRGPAIAAALTRLFSSPGVAANCLNYSTMCDGPAALSAACEELERLADGHAAR